MPDSTFPWIFVALAAGVDLVGLFFLWRRRNSPMGVNHRYRSSGVGRLQIPLTERRRKERRGTGWAASA